MDDKDILIDALKFHGHKCRAGVAGVRGELTAHAYLRVIGAKHVCIPCSGYDR